ncbi:MAG: M13 family metallopeptidase [Bacteroidales bacterium]|nr:M13 family metallopeptidase [Bacteroidales bacterium]
MKKKLILPVALLSLMAMNAASLKGVDRKNFDESVAPGTDFYQHACGGWMKANPLDPQYARFGTFDQMAEGSRAQLKELVVNLGKQQHAAGSLEQKVGDIFNMGMDSLRLNADGAKPLMAHIEMLKGVKKANLAEMVAFLHKGISAPFFDSGVMADLKNSDVNMFYIQQAGMGLGDRDYYLENDANTKKVRDAYTAYINKLFTFIGYKKGDAKKATDAVMKIEKTLAQSAMTREEQRDLNKQYNILTLAQLKAKYPEFGWDAYFAALGLQNVDRVCVAQLDFMTTVNSLLASLKEKELKDYMIFKYVDAASPYLSDAFVAANFDVYSRAMSGKQVMQPRWKSALNVPNSLLGEAVGQLYVEKYFPAEAKKKMQTLVENLRIALGERIANLTWMSPKTKVNALVKLNSFTVKIGYPDKWRDYSAASVNPALSYWENVVALKQHEANWSYSQLFKPVDKDRWQMTPQTVNAYYDPSTNEICFPAGILQPPYFDPSADDASNYGAIGVVIGHEMTHGFDDQGRNFDQNGNMVDWWTEEDANAFKALADKLGAQYNEVIVADDVHANGEFTMGENIADHGGLRIAFSAFLKTEQGKGGALIDGFTPAQRFYLSYANVWAANITKEEILRRTKVDPHSLGKNRVNVALRNIETFFDAFGIKAGDPMFRAEDDRVSIW